MYSIRIHLSLLRYKSLEHIKAVSIRLEPELLASHIPPLLVHGHSAEQAIVERDPLDADLSVWGQRRQRHVRVRVQPTLVVQVLELCEPRAVALQELVVHRLELDQDLG